MGTRVGPWVQDPDVEAVWASMQEGGHQPSSVTYNLDGGGKNFLSGFGFQGNGTVFGQAPGGDPGTMDGSLGPRGTAGKMSAGDGQAWSLAHAHRTTASWTWPTTGPTDPPAVPAPAVSDASTEAAGYTCSTHPESSTFGAANGAYSWTVYCTSTSVGLRSMQFYIGRSGQRDDTLANEYVSSTGAVGIEYESGSSTFVSVELTPDPKPEPDPESVPPLAAVVYSYYPSWRTPHTLNIDPSAPAGTPAPTRWGPVFSQRAWQLDPDTGQMTLQDVPEDASGYDDYQGRSLVGAHWYGSSVGPGGDGTVVDLGEWLDLSYDIDDILAFEDATAATDRRPGGLMMLACPQGIYGDSFPAQGLISSFPPPVTNPGNPPTLASTRLTGSNYFALRTVVRPARYRGIYTSVPGVDLLMRATSLTRTDDAPGVVFTAQSLTTPGRG